jgi:hypothetical protein
MPRPSAMPTRPMVAHNRRRSTICWKLARFLTGTASTLSKSGTGTPVRRWNCRSVKTVGRPKPSDLAMRSWPESGRKESCQRARGRPHGQQVAGLWLDAPLHQALNLPDSSWHRPTGRQADTLQLRNRRFRRAKRERSGRMTGDRHNRTQQQSRRSAYRRRDRLRTACR